MPRKARVEFAGAIYHVLDRGDRREAIVRDDDDRGRFVETLAEVCERTGWRVHAYVLMSNHYHLLIETPEPNLVAGMHWFQSTYTIRFNRRHRLNGHLFQGRYKAVVVEPEAPNYLLTLSDYIHLNPVRAGLIAPEQTLSSYRWSSYPYYAGLLVHAPRWLVRESVLGELGLENSASGGRHYSERMKGRAAEEPAGGVHGGFGELRRGWCLGSEQFRKRMLGLLDCAADLLINREIDGSVRRSHHADEAERILRCGLAFFGVQERELPELKKNDERKLVIGAVIRERTAVTNQWIAKRLFMGHASRASRYCSKGGQADHLRKQIDELRDMATCKD